MSTTVIRIPTERQGQTGRGQGGWACAEFERAIGEPVTVALRSMIPLETDLHVLTDGDTWRLIDPANTDVTILEARRWTPEWPATAAVSIEASEAARASADLTAHHAPLCIACGLGEHTLAVHAGPLPDGRWATPLRFPEWSLLDDGTIDERLVYMAIDCACGWYTARTGQPGLPGLTVQFAAEVDGPLDPDGDYAIVTWPGDGPSDWQGRKRRAAAAMFDSDGACVARSRSFWVRPRR